MALVEVANGMTYDNCHVWKENDVVILRAYFFPIFFNFTKVANSCWKTNFSKFSWKNWSNSKRNHCSHITPIFTRHLPNRLGVGLPFLKDGGMELKFVTLRTCKWSILQVIVRLYLSKNSWYCSFSYKSGLRHFCSPSIIYSVHG